MPKITPRLTAVKALRKHPENVGEYVLAHSDWLRFQQALHNQTVQLTPVFVAVGSDILHNMQQEWERDTWMEYIIAVYQPSGILTYQCVDTPEQAFKHFHRAEFQMGKALGLQDILRTMPISIPVDL